MPRRMSPITWPVPNRNEMEAGIHIVFLQSGHNGTYMLPSIIGIIDPTIGPLYQRDNPIIQSSMQQYFYFGIPIGAQWHIYVA